MKITDNHPYAIINSILRGRAHIAGGALRSYIEGQVPRDIDIFLMEDNVVEYTNIFYDILLGLKGAYPANNHDGYFTMGLNASFMDGNEYEITVIKPSIIGDRRTWGSPEDLVKEVDFSCVGMCLLENNEILFNPDYGEETIIKHIQDKKLVVQKGIPIDSRLQERITKYECKGYYL